MAKTNTPKNTKSKEETLWDSANKLRGTVESCHLAPVNFNLDWISIYQFPKRLCIKSR